MSSSDASGSVVDVLGEASSAGAAAVSVVTDSAGSWPKAPAPFAAAPVPAAPEPETPAPALPGAAPAAAAGAVGAPTASTKVIGVKRSLVRLALPCAPTV